MQAIANFYRLKTKKANELCSIHHVEKLLDRNGNPFCPECVKDDIRKEKMQRVQDFKEQQIFKVLKRNSLTDRSDDFNKSFDNFKAEHDSKEAQVANQLYRIARDYIRYPDKPMNTVLYGTPGEGKTHLSMAMLNMINATHKQRCLFVSVENLFDQIMQSKSGEYTTWNESHARDWMSPPNSKKIGGCDVLVLDDLGSESSMTSAGAEATDYKQKFLKKIFDKQPRVIVNTNLTFKELNRVYNPKLVSRIFENSRGRRVDFSGISDKRY